MSHQQLSSITNVPLPITKKLFDGVIETTIPNLPGSQVDKLCLMRMMTQLKTEHLQQQRTKPSIWVVNAETITQGYTIEALEYANTEFKKLIQNKIIDKVLVLTHSTLIRMGVGFVRLATGLNVHVYNSHFELFQAIDSLSK